MKHTEFEAYRDATTRIERGLAQTKDIPIDSDKFLAAESRFRELKDMQLSALSDLLEYARTHPTARIEWTFPPDAEVATIEGHWHRDENGNIVADYNFAEWQMAVAASDTVERENE